MDLFILFDVVLWYAIDFNKLCLLIFVDLLLMKFYLPVIFQILKILRMIILVDIFYITSLFLFLFWFFLLRCFTLKWGEDRDIHYIISHIMVTIFNSNTLYFLLILLSHSKKLFFVNLLIFNLLFNSVIFEHLTWKIDFVLTFDLTFCCYWQ